MKNIYGIFLITIIGLFGSYTSWSQCTGCTPNTIACQGTNGPCPDTLQPGTVGLAYEDTLTFFLPRQVDASQQSGGVLGMVDFVEFEILSISGLPFGVNWSCNVGNCKYFPSQSANGTFACVRFCGAPLASPGIYNVTILTKGTVSTPFGNQSQDQPFYLQMLVLPNTSSNAGFSMAPPNGCAPLSVQFTNNNPSNTFTPTATNQGFLYQWNFGNGVQSNLENPPAASYPTPGVYPVSYTLTVDTLPFLLQSVTVTNVSCTDNPGNQPDIYIKIFDANGEVYSSFSNQSTTLPFTRTVNLSMNNPPYRIEVWDDDDVFTGADDNCFDGNESPPPTIQLNLPAANNYGPVTQVFNQNGLGFNYSIQKTVFTSTFTDTVIVNALPPVITLGVLPSAAVCNRDSIQLTAPTGYSYEWIKNDTQVVQQGLQNTLTVFTPGAYRVRLIDLNSGCSTLSNDTSLTFFPNLPPGYGTVGIVNNNNVLSSQLSGSGFTYQWLMVNGGNYTPVPPPQGILGNYTPTQNGLYCLVATNSFGCTDTSNIITVANLAVEPDYISNVLVYPNPAQHTTHVYLQVQSGTTLRIQLHDLVGRSVLQTQHTLLAGSHTIPVLLEGLPTGWYLLSIEANGIRKVEKIRVE